MKNTKGRRAAIRAAPHKPVIGLEAEFTLYVRDEKCRPEQVFRSPQEFVREAMLPREGRSFNLPSGGAIYFDTGVIEVATPIIEIEPGCCVRAVRSLWDQIQFLRDELDAWEDKYGTRVRLEGFSTHYNISVPTPRDDRAGLSTALLLAHILPVPMMLLAANRQSTGIGVRPRGKRLEVTADFTTDPDLMIAAASLAVGIVLAVTGWRDHRLDQLGHRQLPVLEGFKPRKHTSRKGWLARFDCFPRNPFAADINAPDWRLRDGQTSSLRQIARQLANPFRRSIRAVTDKEAYEHIFAVLDGRARSLLDFPERPAAYEDVGRIIEWKRRHSRKLPLSNYERVIRDLLKNKKMRIGSTTYVPVRMQGWYEVAFRNARTGQKRVFNLDELAELAR
jgi:hypothetical protein